MLFARRASSERPQRIVDPFRRQLERAEMNADALRRAEIQVRLHRLRRIHVHDVHEPARLVRADRQQREIDRTEPVADVAEERTAYALSPAK